ncbi:MAG TPA: hypothetical protein PLX35_08875 [Cyclobacteriaceae bacterium]|nr:hypothetical protein [Cyclobacteriaceae bacterium]
MKTIAIALLVLIPGFSRCQTIDGAFLHSGWLGHAEGYYFDSDQRFSWFELDGEKETMGRGQYVVADDTLMMIFEKAKRQFKIPKDAVTAAESGREIRVQVIALDQNRAPLPNVEVLVEGTDFQTITDYAGRAELRIANAPRKAVIHFSHPEYDWIDLPVDLAGQNHRIAIAASKRVNYREHKTVLYPIHKEKDRITVMVHHQARIFTKTSRAKYDRLMFSFEHEEN